MGEKEIPSGEKQKDMLSMKLSKSIVEGENWYLIESKWMRSLKQFIGIEEWGSSAVAHPGPVDNAELFDNERGDIKKNLVENIDYILVPEDGWETLVNWYGLTKGQKPICRKAIKLINDYTMVEVYLQDLRCIKDFDPQSEIRIKASKADSMDKIQSKLRSAFNIPFEIETRMWQTVGHKEELLQMDKTIQGNGLSEHQCIVIETMTQDSASQKKSYLKQSIRSSTENLYSIPSTSTNFPRSRESSLNNSNKQPGLCGLSNLGNTCFMNSVLQCMSNCPPITEYFLEGKHLLELNERNPLGMKGEIAKAYGELIEIMWSGKASITMPQKFKIQVGIFNPAFCGCQQHDSQELLTFLLDGLHEDLNRIITKPYIVVNDDLEKEDSVLAHESWENYRKRNDSIIVDTFHGLLKSTVVCPECERASVTFDPFCYLSLPLPLKKDRGLTVRYIPYEGLKAENLYRVTVPKKGLIRDLCLEMQQLTNGNPDHMLVAEITSCHFHKFFCNDDNLDSIEEKDVIYVFQLTVVPNPMDNRHMVFPVCFWEAINSCDEFSQKNIFGVPFLIVLPYTLITKDELHSLIFQKMERHFRIPELKIKLHNGSYNREMINENELEFEDDVFKLFVIDTSVYSNPQKLLAEGDCYDLPAIVGGQRPEKNFGRHALLLQFTTEKCQELYFEKSPTPYNLSSNYNKDKNKVSIQDCLSLFTTCEKLSADDAWYCPRCKKHKRATKKFDLWKLPKILIIHLKRFQYTRYRRDKIDTLVEFPVTDLNMSDYVISSDKNEGEMMYDLVGVCNHYGNMGGGHYTAYCKNKDTKKWYRFDDNTVSCILEDNITSSAAYVLFYMAKDNLQHEFMDLN